MDFLKEKINDAYSSKKLLFDKLYIANYLLMYALFFGIVAFIVQALVKFGYKH